MKVKPITWTELPNGDLVSVDCYKHIDIDGAVINHCDMGFDYIIKREYDRYVLYFRNIYVVGDIWRNVENLKYLSKMTKPYFKELAQKHRVEYLQSLLECEMEKPLR